MKQVRVRDMNRIQRVLQGNNTHWGISRCRGYHYWRVFLGNSFIEIGGSSWGLYLPCKIEKALNPMQLWGRYIAYWMATVMLGVGCWGIGSQTWQATDWLHKAVVSGGIICGVLGMMCYFMAGWLIQPVVNWCWARVRHQEATPFVDMLKF